MKNINIGVANLVISDLLKESFFNESLLTEAKKITSVFFKTIKSSPLLMLEFKVFDNIENKQIDNDVLGTRYIDNNVKLFEIYTIDELHEENEKLKQFLVDVDYTKLNENKLKLYNSISTLIEESLKIGDDVNIDAIFDSFTFVLNHLKDNKKKNEPLIYENINEDVIKIAINKFNEKYNDLNENELNLFKKLINSSTNEKQQIFEEYKNKNIDKLKLLVGNSYDDKINESLNKINKMDFNVETADNDIIKLFELNKGLY